MGEKDRRIKKKDLKLDPSDGLLPVLPTLRSGMLTKAEDVFTLKEKRKLDKALSEYADRAFPGFRADKNLDRFPKKERMAA